MIPWLSHQYLQKKICRGLQGRPIWAFAPPEDHPEGTPDTGDFWSKNLAAFQIFLAYIIIVVIYL